MLGFLDDIFDIRWRHKVPIPIIASIPLLIVYYAEQGKTDVVVPLPLRWLFGTLINLGMTFRLCDTYDLTMEQTYRPALLCIYVSTLHLLH